MGKTKRGNGTKPILITGDSAFPLAVHTASAHSHGVVLVQAALNEGCHLGKTLMNYQSSCL